MNGEVSSIRNFRKNWVRLASVNSNINGVVEENLKALGVQECKEIVQG